MKSPIAYDGAIQDSATEDVRTGGDGVGLRGCEDGREDCEILGEPPLWMHMHHVSQHQSTWTRAPYARNGLEVRATQPTRERLRARLGSQMDLWGHTAFTTLTPKYAIGNSTK